MSCSQRCVLCCLNSSKSLERFWSWLMSSFILSNCICSCLSLSAACISSSCSTVALSLACFSCWSSFSSSDSTRRTFGSGSSALIKHTKSNEWITIIKVRIHLKTLYIASYIRHKRSETDDDRHLWLSEPHKTKTDLPNFSRPKATLSGTVQTRSKTHHVMCKPLSGCEISDTLRVLMVPQSERTLLLLYIQMQSMCFNQAITKLGWPFFQQLQ